MNGPCYASAMDEYFETRDETGRLLTFGTARDWTIVNWRAFEKALHDIQEMQIETIELAPRFTMLGGRAFTADPQPDAH